MVRRSTSRRLVLAISGHCVEYGVTHVLTDQFHGESLAALANSMHLPITVHVDKPTAAERLRRYESLYMKFMQEQIEIPRRPARARADLLAIKRRISRGNDAWQITMATTPDGRHADYAPAIALACERVSLEDALPEWCRAMEVRCAPGRCPRSPAIAARRAGSRGAGSPEYDFDDDRGDRRPADRVESERGKRRGFSARRHFIPAIKGRNQMSFWDQFSPRTLGRQGVQDLLADPVDPAKDLDRSVMWNDGEQVVLTGVSQRWWSAVFTARFLPSPKSDTPITWSNAAEEERSKAFKRAVIAHRKANKE